ncbi:PREDICTED: uncharacterized protein LOC109167893 [Ipomoea nil]|uniref:uncharacterized protein LOC109158480 n=1 Tax=Ipomoea nil TaxID=35883 RepID=UPI000901C34E|nr:PREDICTED: uncharacterized protein LOC109158480 [Ipomoea nil]XP_019165442.1 PREDICTED: uncharacterized protein LOC109161479 [Ipomoea nil]XP_019167119.1 PREDICTED: uncharacterized protein LOC109162862 [Ipomoea nil]XP_019172509.1 PREDICTED: uncharacterized protein LOC109167893 [Ipomoea nil]
MSSSSTSSRVKVNMEYEPSVYCNCGLKAPMCTSRESGKKFFGCQRWKDGNGCGFFLWNDHSARRIEGEHEDLKKMVVSLRNEIEVVKELIVNEYCGMKKEKEVLRIKCVVLLIVIVVLLAKLCS